MRKLSLVLCFAMLFACFSVVCHAGGDYAPCYDSVVSVSAELEISNVGVARVDYFYAGVNNVTKSVKITTVIQKSVAGSWENVYNGEPNNEWIDNTTQLYYENYHLLKLNSRGNYRSVVTFEITTFSGPKETITCISEKTL